MTVDQTKYDIKDETIDDSCTVSSIIAPVTLDQIKGETQDYSVIYNKDVTLDENIDVTLEKSIGKRQTRQYKRLNTRLQMNI